MTVADLEGALERLAGHLVGAGETLKQSGDPHASAAGNEAIQAGLDLLDDLGVGYEEAEPDEETEE